MKSIKFLSHYPQMPHEMRFHTKAPNGLITLYGSIENKKTGQTEYTHIIGYLHIQDKNITTLNSNKEPIEEYHTTKYTIDEQEKTVSFKKSIFDTYYDQKNLVGMSHDISIQQHHKEKWIDTYTLTNHNPIFSKTKYYTYAMSSIFTCNAPACIENIFSLEISSPSYFPSHILDLIEKNEGDDKENFKANSLFILDQEFGLYIVCTHYLDDPREYLYTKEGTFLKLLRPGFASCGKTEFQKFLINHGGNTAHEKIDIITFCQNRQSFNNFYENFVVRSRNILRKQESFTKKGLKNDNPSQKYL